MIKEEAECTRYIGSSDYIAEDYIAEDVAAEVKVAQTTVQSVNQQASANAPLMAQIPELNTAPNKGVIPLQHVEAPITPDYPNRTPDTVPFTPYHMFEFATGDIEKCFGPDFSIYRA